MSHQRQRTSTSAQFGVFDTSGTYMNRDIYILQCLPLEALKCLPCLPVERKVIRTSGSSIILGKQDYVEVRSAQKNGCLGLCLKDSKGVRHTCLFPIPSLPLVRDWALPF